MHSSALPSLYLLLLPSEPEQTEYGIGIVIVPILLGAIYFIPAIVGRKKRAAMSILLLNLFLGWTFLGWIGALIWAVADDAPPVVIRPTASTPVSVADELMKLQALRENGSLSEEEFNQQRQRLLNRPA